MVAWLVGQMETVLQIVAPHDLPGRYAVKECMGEVTVGARRGQLPVGQTELSAS